jgi:DNA recombination protein RmuC
MLQVIVKDSAMREQAHLVQQEVGRILEDVKRLSDRVGKLDNHFRQANEDLSNIATSAEKITRRGEKVMAMELNPEEPQRALKSGPMGELLPFKPVE